MKKTYGTFATFMLLLTAGTIVLNAEDLDRTYVCPPLANTTEGVQVFNGGLSSTGFTGYPDTKGVEGQLCKANGISTRWEKVCDYAERQGLKCSQGTDLPAEGPCSPTICTQDGCSCFKRSG